jgi:hypothetical protein
MFQKQRINNKRFFFCFNCLEALYLYLVAEFFFFGLQTADLVDQLFRKYPQLYENAVVCSFYPNIIYTVSKRMNCLYADLLQFELEKVCYVCSYII